MSMQMAASRREKNPGIRMATWLCVAVLFLLDSGFLLQTPPAKADSEAASESGGVLGGRRARRRYRMQQMQQQKMDNQHERAVRQNTARQDQHMRNLKPQQMIHNYHFAGHGQGQGAQNTSQTSAKQQSPPPSQSPSH